MTMDEAIEEIKDNMSCDYCISGCDKCDISSCSNKDAFNIAIQALERNRKSLSTEVCIKNALLAEMLKLHFVNIVQIVVRN